MAGPRLHEGDISTMPLVGQNVASENIDLFVVVAVFRLGDFLSVVTRRRWGDRGGVMRVLLCWAVEFKPARKRSETRKPAMQ